jgi:hypothetical protein
MYEHTARTVLLTAQIFQVPCLFCLQKKEEESTLLLGSIYLQCYFTENYSAYIRHIRSPNCISIIFVVTAIVVVIASFCFVGIERKRER